MAKPVKPTTAKKSRDLFLQAQRLRELARIERDTEYQAARQYKSELIAHVAETLSTDPYGRAYNRSGAAEIGIDYTKLRWSLENSRSAHPDQIAKAEQAAKLAYQIGTLAAQLKDLKTSFFKEAAQDGSFFFYLTEAATLRPQGDRYEDQN